MSLQIVCVMPVAMREEIMSTNSSTVCRCHFRNEARGRLQNCNEKVGWFSQMCVPIVCVTALHCEGGGCLNTKVKSLGFLTVTVIWLGKGMRTLTSVCSHSAVSVASRWRWF